MKVDILGRGAIPGLNSIAPTYNADLSLVELQKIVKIGTLRPVVAGTNIAIHRRNLDDLFKIYSTTETSVTPVAVPKKAEKKPEPVKVEQVAEPVTEENLEPVAEAPVEEPKEAVEVAETEEATLEVTDEEEATEEATEEHQNYSSKKKNKKR